MDDVKNLSSPFGDWRCSVCYFNVAVCNLRYFIVPFFISFYYGLLFFYYFCDRFKFKAKHGDKRRFLDAVVDALSITHGTGIGTGSTSFLVIFMVEGVEPYIG